MILSKLNLKKVLWFILSAFFCRVHVFLAGAKVNQEQSRKCVFFFSELFKSWFSKKRLFVGFSVYRLRERDRLRRLFLVDFLRSREPSRSRLVLRFRALRSLSLRSSLSFRRSDLPRDLLRDRLRSTFILLISFFDLSFERDRDRLRESRRDFFLSSISFLDFRSFDLERVLLLLDDLLLERLLERLLDEPDSEPE